ncbi:MAG TPA: discoidin domain-containing protein, partial [Anaerolineae bacterium]
LTYTWVDPQTAQVVERGDTFALVADTPTGRTALFENVTVRAPKTPGTRILRWDLIQEGITPYSAQGTRTLDATVEITAPIPDWAAKFTRPFQAGATVEPNETLAGDVAVDNVGTQTWTPDVVKLGYRWLTQDGQEISVGTDRDAQSFALASNVGRNASTLFAHLAVRAPVRQGRYTLRFDLRHDDEWFSAGPSLPSDQPVEVRSAAPDYLARWDAVPQLPGILIADSTTTVQVGVTNIGAQVWFSHGANAVSLRGRWFDESYAPIDQQPDGCGVEQDVLPRDSYQFETVSLRVPHEPGEYTLIWDLYRAGAEGFGTLGSPTPSQRLTVRPEQRDYQAQFVAHDTPGNLPVNAEVSVNLRVRNIGAQVWRAFAMPLARQGADRRVALGYRWLDHEGNLVPSSKDWRSALSRDVKPDEEVVLRARLAAPPAPGTYELQWDLLVADDSFGTPLKCVMSITGAETPASYWRAEASLHAESAQRAVDGQVDTAWSSVAPQDTGMEFRVHFNTPRVMDALAFRSPGHGHPYGLKLEVSAEGETWHTVLQVENGNTTDVLATFMPQNIVAARLDLVAPSPTHSPWLVSEVAYHAGALWSVTASVNDELAARVLQIGAGAWSTNSAQKNETWFQLNLGRVELVSGLQLLPPRDENPRACVVLAWNEDTRAWQRVASVQDNTDPLDVTFAPLRT